jgi:hypothetical protein
VASGVAFGARHRVCARAVAEVADRIAHIAFDTATP